LIGIALWEVEQLYELELNSRCIIFYFEAPVVQAKEGYVIEY